MPRASNRRVAGTLFLVAGVAIIALGVYLGRSMLRLESAGLAAPGSVVALHTHLRRHTIVYRPVIRFTTASGSEVQFEDSSGSNPPAYRVGEQLRVRYLASTPANSAIIDQGIWNWSGPIILAVFGVLIIGIGIARISHAPG
jgi:hypothetical protein